MSDVNKPTSPRAGEGATSARCVKLACGDCKLVSITVIRNATQTNVTGAKNWAAVKKATDAVIVQATTTPNTQVCWDAIAWSGDTGTAVPGHPNQRALSRSVSKKLHIGASLEGASDFLEVWVIWADIEVKIGDGDTLDSGNDSSGLAAGHKWPAALGGGNKLGPISSIDTGLVYSYVVGKMQAKAILSPPGIEDIVKSGWSMRRKKTIKGYSNGTQYRTTGVDDDDTSYADWVDNDPKSGTSKGEIYDLDAPGCDVATAANMDRTHEVYKNFKQYVTVTLDSEQICSEDKAWSYQVWIDLDKATGKVEKNSLSLSHITIPTTPHYAAR